MTDNNKYIFRRKVDGYIIVYNGRNPKEWKHAQEMIRNKEFELISTVEGAAEQPKAYKEVPVVEDVLECPICGEQCKDDAALLKHKKDVHDRKKKT